MPRSPIGSRLGRLKGAAFLLCAGILGGIDVIPSPLGNLPPDFEPVSYYRASDDLVGKGVGYLNTIGQSADGSFTTSGGPAVTAIVTTAMIANGRPIDDPVVAKSLGSLEGFVQPDGGIYSPKSHRGIYETCQSMVCFKQANRDGRYDKLLRGGEQFVKSMQFSRSDCRKPSDVSYGGVGCAGSEHPDLSNTHCLLSALQAAGNGPGDDAVKRALIFISRCQNLATEHNTTPFAPKNPDGGFYFSPVDQGANPAGRTASGGLRSCGSMTYAGLESMLSAGLGHNDPRVRAAIDWIRRNYTLGENPGLGQDGHFYYLYLVARTLHSLRLKCFTDANGVVHNWRQEIVVELTRRQQPDGSWGIKGSPWLEDDSSLATGYALLCLSYCRSSK